MSETMTARELLDSAMAEEQLQDAVTELLDSCGWKWMHIPDRLYKLAAKEGRWDAMSGAKGFPDLLALHPSGRLLVIECKTEAGDVQPEQEEWFRLWGVFVLRLWGLIPARHHEEMLDVATVVIWRPSDWSSGAIEAVVRGEPA